MPSVRVSRLIVMTSPHSWPNRNCGSPRLVLCAPLYLLIRSRPPSTASFLGSGPRHEGEHEDISKLYPFCNAPYFIRFYLEIKTGSYQTLPSPVKTIMTNRWKGFDISYQEFITIKERQQASKPPVSWWDYEELSLIDFVLVGDRKCLFVETGRMISVHGLLSFRISLSLCRPSAS